MKKSMLILILTSLLTSCGIQESEPIITVENEPLTEITETEFSTKPTAQTITEIAETTVVATVHATTSTTESTASEEEKIVTEIAVQAEEKIAVEVVGISENKIQPQAQETETPIQEEPQIATEPTPTQLPQNAENTAITVSESEKYEEETEPPECVLSDYEKALEVYNYMTVNGGGTCVQYAWQTYEMCCECGLECRFAWTENQLYGHVANVVRIDGAWYVLDTQADCFLTENIFGFTEIVDENENHIANADIISGIRYDQLNH